MPGRLFANLQINVKSAKKPFLEEPSIAPDAALEEVRRGRKSMFVRIAARLSHTAEKGVVIALPDTDEWGLGILRYSGPQ